MDEFNPYEPPEAPTDPVDTPRTPFYRDGRLLVLRKGEELPARCVRCNASARRERTTLEFSTYHLWWPMHRSARVAVPLCPDHGARRRRAIVLGALGLATGMGLFYVGVSRGFVFLAFASIPLVVSSYCVLDRSIHVVSARRITSRFVWLGKICPAFLADLPDWRPAGRAA